MTNELLRAAVQQVRIESRLLPTITLNDPFGPARASATRDALMALLRPRIVLVTPTGEIARAPWGEPGNSLWPILRAVLAGGAVAGAAWYLWKSRLLA